MSQPVTKDAVPPPIYGAEGDLTHSSGRFSVLMLGSIGVVFGDIGTSPLYSLQTALGQFKGAALPPAEVIGVVSLIIWALLIVVTAKYVLFLMQADNKGEGGILSLMALAQRALGQKTPIAFLLGVAGAALFSGDAIITPAISVLSALEGLKQVDPNLTPYILPATIVILVVLFAAQSRGTAKVAAFFSPIMVAFFAVNAVLGIVHIASDWRILEALSPIPGVELHLRSRDNRIYRPRQRVSGGDRRRSALRRYGPFRAEADPGGLAVHRSAGAHLQLSRPRRAHSQRPEGGRKPILFDGAELGLGAARSSVDRRDRDREPGRHHRRLFAGQPGDPARIAAAPRNRPHLLHSGGADFHPPRHPRAPARESWRLVLLFRSSDALANAYGIAVSGTMVATTSLAFFVVWKLWRWPLWAALALTGAFLSIDVGFFIANLYKVVDGGWVPLTLGAAMFILMWTWSRGSAILLARTHRDSIPMLDLIKMLERSKPVRVQGTSVFLTNDPTSAPSSLMHNLKHNKVLHERVVLLNVRTETTPRVPPPIDTK